MSAAMMAALPREAWLRLAIWLVVGLGLYFSYGFRHSATRRGASNSPSAEGGSPT